MVCANLFSEWNNGVVLQKRKKIITGAVFNFIDTRFPPVYDGNDVGGIPPTLVVFISYDNGDKRD